MHNFRFGQFQNSKGVLCHSDFVGVFCHTFSSWAWSQMIPRTYVVQGFRVAAYLCVFGRLTCFELTTLKPQTPYNRPEKASPPKNPKPEPWSSSSVKNGYKNYVCKTQCKTQPWGRSNMTLESSKIFTLRVGPEKCLSEQQWNKARWPKNPNVCWEAEIILFPQGLSARRVAEWIVSRSQERVHENFWDIMTRKGLKALQK